MLGSLNAVHADQETNNKVHKYPPSYNYIFQQIKPLLPRPSTYLGLFWRQWKLNCHSPYSIFQVKYIVYKQTLLSNHLKGRFVFTIQTLKKGSILQFYMYCKSLNICKYVIWQFSISFSVCDTYTLSSNISGAA